jgi:cysteine desulfurase/selenocysteine lyase
VAFLVAAILGYEGGIGVRSGCFCAHPYVVHPLGLTARTWFRIS